MKAYDFTFLLCSIGATVARSKEIKCLGCCYWTRFSVWFFKLTLYLYTSVDSCLLHSLFFSGSWSSTRESWARVRSASEGWWEGEKGDIFPRAPCYPESRRSDWGRGSVDSIMGALNPFTAKRANLTKPRKLLNPELLNKNPRIKALNDRVLSNGGAHIADEQSTCFCKFYF